MTVLEMETATVPGGRTWIGASLDDKFANGGEQIGEWIDIGGPFEIGRHPVTIHEWREFEPGRFEELDGSLPAHGISWIDAVTFVGWLRRETGDQGWSLPSAHEWEHAARAGTATVFPGGNTLNPSDANFLYDEAIERVGSGRMTPVGSYPANAFGLYDMIGNVCEWTKEPGRRTGSHRIRGGAWDYLPRLLRCSWSDEIPDDSERDNVGFRLVRRSGNTLPA